MSKKLKTYRVDCLTPVYVDQYQLVNAENKKQALEIAKQLGNWTSYEDYRLMNKSEVYKIKIEKEAQND